MGKDRVLVGAGGRGRGVARRKEGLLGGGTGWKVKTGEDGEDGGEEKVEPVDGETGESCSEPEREEEEPETKHTGRGTTEAREMSQRRKKILELAHTITPPNPTYLD